MTGLEESLAGSLLGAALGDGIGLPLEGISRRRQRRICRDVSGCGLLLGTLMVSDDTEHACMVAQALIAAGGDADVFGEALARRLRIWLLALPAGVGLATLKARLRLLIGVGWRRSGIYSAGNGPAMRSAVLGLCYGSDPAKLRQFVRVSTRITHTDPKAEAGALAVALAAHHARMTSPPRLNAYYDALVSLLNTSDGLTNSEMATAKDDLLDLVRRAIESATRGDTTDEFADSLGQQNGVGGYIYRTVPVVLHAWFRHPGAFEPAVVEVVRCGGDTDTTGAILGGILGGAVGEAGLPAVWLNRLRDRPRTAPWMRMLGHSLAVAIAEGKPARPPEVRFLFVVARNIVFLVAVLAHGFRRLLPPY